MSTSRETEANISKYNFIKKSTHTPYNQIENIKKYNNNKDKHISFVRFKQIKINENNVEPFNLWNKTLINYEKQANLNNK